MSDLKEFLSKNRWMTDWSCQERIYEQGDNLSIESLGLFFWERGGKQFSHDNLFVIANSKELKDWISDAKEDIFNQTSDALNARDFLDCLACLGEEKVKELIKELEK